VRSLFFTQMLLSPALNLLITSVRTPTKNDQVALASSSNTKRPFKVLLTI
jgi:hypothetical protein